MSELNTFLVSYKVKGQRIVIVGGGEEALNKVRLVTKTTASVVILSQEFAADLSSVPAELRANFTPDVLDGTALVFVAEASELAELVKAEARRRGLPVNVVDAPDECDFYVPSIVARAPL